jgi:hypothetical protein
MEADLLVNKTQVNHRPFVNSLTEITAVLLGYPPYRIPIYPQVSNQKVQEMTLLHRVAQIRNTTVPELTSTSYRIASNRRMTEASNHRLEMLHNIHSFNHRLEYRSLLLRKVGQTVSGEQVQLRDYSSLEYRIEHRGNVLQAERVNALKPRLETTTVLQDSPFSTLVPDIELHKADVDRYCIENGFVKSLFKLGIRDTLQSFKRYFNAKDLMVHFYNWRFYHRHGFWQTLQSGRVFNAVYTLLEKNILMPILETQISFVNRRIEFKKEKTIDQTLVQFISDGAELRPFMLAEYKRMARKGKLECLRENYSPFRLPKIEVASTLAITLFIERLFPLIQKNITLIDSSPLGVIWGISAVWIGLPIIMGYVVEPAMKKLKKKPSSSTYLSTHRVPIPVPI